MYMIGQDRRDSAEQPTAWFGAARGGTRLARASRWEDAFKFMCKALGPRAVDLAELLGVSAIKPSQEAPADECADAGDMYIGEPGRLEWFGLTRNDGRRPGVGRRETTPSARSGNVHSHQAGGLGQAPVVGDHGLEIRAECGGRGKMDSVEGAEHSWIERRGGVQHLFHQVAATAGALGCLPSSEAFWADRHKVGCRRR